MAPTFFEKFCIYAEQAICLFSEVVVVFEVAGRALKALLTALKTAW